MKKSLVSACAVLLTAPLLGLVGTAPTASAAPKCGSYPPGHAFGIRNSPDPRRADGSVIAVSVRRGSSITLSARLFRDGQVCTGEGIYFYFHGPNDFKTVNGKRTAVYHYSQSPATTDGSGIARISVKVVNDFRWFVNYNLPVTYPVQAVSNTQGARTDGQSLVRAT